MLKKVTVAVSAALFSGVVSAQAPSVVPDIEIFMSGATAQDKGIAALFDNLCVAGTLDTFKDNANPAKPGKGYSAYFCTLDNAKVPGLTLTNPSVLFHKRSAGGSAQGVNPVIDEVSIEAMDINNTANVAAGNCTETAAGSHDWRCTIDQPGDLIFRVSDAGVSDVNPEMFVGENTPANNNPVNAADVANKMVVTPAAAVVFGIPATRGLRDALQEAEVAAGILDAGCTAQPSRTGSATVDPTGDVRESEACMPSMTKAQVSAIMAGRMKNWSSFLVNGTPLTAVASNVPAQTQVTVCRRVNGSGTQAQMNAKFLHYPCTTNAYRPASAGNPFQGPIIGLNSGSGDVSACLNDWDNNTNATGFNASTTNGGLVIVPGRRWAIGLQSTEKNADLFDDFRFVKIDGVAPTLKNAASGKYFDAVEQTFQWRKPAFNGPTGDMLAILSTIANSASSPDILSTNLNPSFLHSFGQAGYLALTTNGNSIDADTVTAGVQIDYTTHPVTSLTHKTTSGLLDNCIAPVIDSSNPDTPLF